MNSNQTATAQWAAAQELEKKHKRRSSMGPAAMKSGPGSLANGFPSNGGGVGDGRNSQILGSGSVQGGYSGSPVTAVNSGDLNSFSWEVWDAIRTLCGYHPRLGLGKFAKGVSA